ncbi:MAG: hypothetical protein ACXAC5_03940 [Promethearchaeota archaeon]|jgi:hypothetical protein
MVVGAIWRLNSEYSEKINQDWIDGLFVILSKCGTNWCGFIASVAISIDVPRIDDSMPGIGRVPIGAELIDSWEQVRLDLINGRLGEPTEGINVLTNKIKIQTNMCTCGLYVFMRNGCPSSRGLPCPDLHDEDE